MTYKPKHWFFGHFTHFVKGETDGCRWESLSSMVNGGLFWDKGWLEWDDDE